MVTTQELDHLYGNSSGGAMDTTPYRGKSIANWLISKGYKKASEVKIKIGGQSVFVWAIDKVAVGWPNALIQEDIKKHPLYFGSKAE